MGKKVVVPGGAGDIGREVVDRLVAASHDVTVLTRKDVADHTVDGITWVKADYTSVPSLIPLVKGADVVAIGERVRGSKFSVEYAELEDLARTDLRTSWVPRLERPSLSSRDKDEVSVWVCCDMLRGIQAGSWSIGREWNDVFPDYKVKSIEEFLRSVDWVD
ncbi:hypothetical protein ACJZ2D_003425 [Fusarium nematophilum]